MESKKPSLVKDVMPSANTALVEKTLNEVQLARLVASHGGNNLLDDPDADINKVSKTAKRKAEGVERSKAVSKESNAPIEDEGVEGEKEEAVDDPCIKDSQTLGGSIGRQLGASSSKDAFPDEVPSQFSIDYTALNPEASEETTAQLKNLVEGFPKPFPLKKLCDPDVIIKAGLCQGEDKFKGISLGVKERKCPYPQQGELQDHRHREGVGQPTSGSEESCRPKKSKANEPSPTVTPPASVTPGLTSQEVESVPFEILPRTSLRFFPLGLSEHSLDESLRFREATKAGYPMFLKLQKATADVEELEREKSSFGNLLRQMREERDSAIAEKNKEIR
ncbi:hypothetical protein LIER_19704 [Lithospermum erythrorhizon]|uniref:Uncharacterized protein n=1 Tax=Lithospermum erythrorhizon TaxID=34254 RepID=A0AAV3QJU5_LITER